MDVLVSKLSDTTPPLPGRFCGGPVCKQPPADAHMCTPNKGKSKGLHRGAASWKHHPSACSSWLGEVGEMLSLSLCLHQLLAHAACAGVRSHAGLSALCLRACLPALGGTNGRRTEAVCRGAHRRRATTASRSCHPSLRRTSWPRCACVLSGRRRRCPQAFSCRRRCCCRSGARRSTLAPLATLGSYAGPPGLPAPQASPPKPAAPC
mmetsp:Transcript_13086/g.38060  ORF Transcript_13086/g.38060 Transcript_13086/m.38060 type:complete len:207 (-) Transcript_13086:719-1339(-)